MEIFDHKKIDRKWQEQWEKAQLYKAAEHPKKKQYTLDMFPYPSGAGLHVGHPEGYTATDILSRFLRMNGYDVLHPMGWDAFGLPAENYAIKQGVPPWESTAKNIDRFREQIQSIGLSYDWSREVNTSSPDYYRWTQWLFLQLYKKGLAYKKEAYVNWCPKDQTVLANEQVVNGACERCGTVVVQKLLSQWFFKITDYADRLLNDLDKLDWPEPIKLMQKNWIGRSEGAEIEFGTENQELKIKVFTTRPDTLFGATYMVLAPEHPLVETLTTPGQRNYVINYVTETKKKTELQRTALEKDKTGVFTGAYAINPATKEKIPVWIADYVLMNYGTGAIMAVPAHDERDFEFAKKYQLPIKQVVAPETGMKRPNEERRDGGCGIIFDPKTQKYGVSKKPEGFYGFFGGGVDDSEDEREGILREVKEESGLYDFGHIEKIAEAFPHYHNEVKKLNRFTKAACYLIILKSAKTHPQKLEDHEKLELIWVKPEEILKNWQEMTHFKDLKDTEHWTRFLNEAVARAIELGFDKTSDPKKYQSSAFTDKGILVNSGRFNDMNSDQAKAEITKYAGGKLKTQYKLRDWLVSRQRYWGAPIPIIYCEKCGMQPVLEKDLPVLLPTDVDFQPKGQSPLASSKSFHKVKCPNCGADAQRDSDTMDTFVDSSWYFFRFTDPHNDQVFADKKKMKDWLPVDTYVGGAEHAVLHLLYARFFTKALHDLKYISFEEPFIRLRNQGLILGPDGEKMSKSRGNVINPDEVIAEFGADAFRMYEMFMGPLEEAKPWQTNGIVGIKRFLDKVWRYQQVFEPGAESKGIHKLIKKITGDIESFKFNTAIAAFMEFLNENKKMSKENWETFLILLAPFAPHITEELWHQLKHKDSIHLQPWPKFDKKQATAEQVTVVVQVLGRVRASLELPAGLTQAEVKQKALAEENVKKHLAGKDIVKEIFVADKLINFVVK